MNDLAHDLLPFLPERYRPQCMLLLVLSPHLTRALYALRHGGGLRGVLTSIWLGTNTPAALTARVATLEQATVIVRP